MRLYIRKDKSIYSPRSALSKASLSSIQEGTLKYTYRGLSCLKNPFDLALYTLLLYEIQPKTIIEIGSAAGGSALWLSDQTALLGLETRIYSLDIAPPKGLLIDRVEFLQGDIYALERSSLAEIMRSAVHPILVIEDGPHTYGGCKNALEFVDTFLHSGDYIVIEDGIVHELELTEYEDGPNRAIMGFLEPRIRHCQIDRDYCDYFGINFTWNTNGYIRYL